MSTSGFGSAITFGIVGSTAFSRRIASSGSTLWSICARSSTRRYGLLLKFLIVPPMILAFPTSVCTLSRVSIVVLNKPIARTAPSTSPAMT